MKPTRISLWRALLAALALPALAAVLATALVACEVSSSDSVSANVSNSAGETYDFSGTYYAATVGQPLVSPAKLQSGTLITWLRLMQSGSSLQGYDSARQTWSGRISSLSGSTAQFTLKGRTTAGHSVDVVGSLSYASGNATMNGSWLESSGNSASIYAYASVSTNAPVVTPTNTPSTTDE